MSNTLFEDDENENGVPIEEIIDALEDAYYILTTKQEPHKDLLRRIRKILKDYNAA
jgi:hypothetical protein